MAIESRVNMLADKQNGALNGAPSNGAFRHPATAGVAPRRVARSASGYDWLGAVLRRKGIVLFAVVVSSVLGYLHFLRQPKVYSSSMKLMIWTQAPPRLVNDETVINPVSTGKHETLIRSEVVLSKAGQDGEIKTLKTFAGRSNPTGLLRSMITVAPAKDAADTIVLSAKGPHPEELPIVLTDVVAAYQEILSEDSAAISKSSLDLVGKLQEKIEEEKSTSEQRYLELVQKLAVSPDPQTGKYANPHFASIEGLKQIKAGKDRTLREVTEQIASIKDVVDNADQSSGELLRVIAFEAAQRLHFQPATRDRPEIEEASVALDRLDARIRSVEERIYETRLKSLKARRAAVGERHPTASSAAADLELLAGELSSLQEQRKRALNEMATKMKDAAATAETTPPSYSDIDREMVKTYLMSLQRERDQLQNAVTGIEKEIADEEARAAKVRGEIEELNVLAAQIKEKDNSLRELVDQLSSLTVVASNYTSTKVRVIDSPGYGGQIAPVLSNSMILFVFAGCVIGFGVVVLLDWSDMSFRSPEDIRDKLGVPVVTRIARMTTSGKFKDGHSENLVTLERPKSAIAEAYRACRAAMLFMAKQQNLKCFLITSPTAGDGKSTTAVNLAMCFAQGGLSTVIVDADLRRPRCNIYLGLQPSPGLKDFSTGDSGLEHVVRQSELHSNLSVITAGKHFSSPSEFLNSQLFAGLLRDLRSRFDIVIIDSPPVLPVADAMALASLCDAVLLVLKIRKGVVVAAEKAVETLRSVDANILGVVVNQVEKLSHYSDYGKYGYGGYGKGYGYYGSRYYDKQNAQYYENDTVAE